MRDAPTGTKRTPLISKKISSAVCIEYNGSVCLGRRALICAVTGKTNSFAGYWSPFGGLVEEGENPMCGAVRELKEETGISINISDLSYIQEIENSDGFTYILYAYHASKLLYPKLNFEHDEYGYFRLSDLTVSPTPMCPKVSSSLIDYDKRRWKGGSIII